MKKLFCLVLACALLFGCTAEDLISEWVASYNLLAVTHGLEELNADDFLYDSQDELGDYYVYSPDEDTTVMLCMNDDGTANLVSMEALKNDTRLAPMLACAMTVSNDMATYDEALSSIQSILIAIALKQSDSGVLFGWYYMGYSLEEDGQTYLLIGFSDIGFEDDEPVDAGSEDAPETPEIPQNPEMPIPTPGIEKKDEKLYKI